MKKQIERSLNATEIEAYVKRISEIEEENAPKV